MTEYKLSYFNSRGLAEPIRLVFALAQQEYEDCRMTQPFGTPLPPDIKQKLPYGQLPLLEFDSHSLSQSTTIARYLARKFNFMGNSDLEAAKIDEIIDACGDLKNNFYPIVFSKDESVKASTKKNVLEVLLPKYFGKFSEILSSNGSGFLVGTSVSLADLVIFNMIPNVEAIVQLDVAKEYPAMNAHYEKIGAIPQIKKWIETRPKTPM